MRDVASCASWDRHQVAEAVKRVAATTDGVAIYSELKRLGWWWGGTRESINRAKQHAKASPHRERIHRLLAELYNREIAEYDRLTLVGLIDQPASTRVETGSGQDAPLGCNGPSPAGPQCDRGEGSKRGHPFG